MTLRDDLEADVVKVIDFMALTTEHSQQYLEQTAALVIDRILDTLADRADEWIEAEAQLSIKPGPRKIQNWRRMWPDQLANLIAILRGDTQ